MTRFSGTKIEFGIHSFVHRIGILLITALDEIVGHYHLGFHHISVSYTIDFVSCYSILLLYTSITTFLIYELALFTLCYQCIRYIIIIIQKFPYIIYVKYHWSIGVLILLSVQPQKMPLDLWSVVGQHFPFW